jgi:hypothetical protein
MSYEAVRDGRWWWSVRRVDGVYLPLSRHSSVSASDFHSLYHCPFLEGLVVRC